MNLTHYFIFMLLCLFINQINCNGHEYENYKFHFVPGSGMGFFLALAVPINIPNKSVYMSYLFEANYNLPGNETSYEYPPIIEKSIDRQLVYAALETKMNSSGYPGKPCLLRLICESALSSVQHANGVLGDILHIIFTPSSSTNGDLPNDYELAEKDAKINNNCTNYNSNCSVSFLDLISWIGESV